MLLESHSYSSDSYLHFVFFFVFCFFFMQGFNLRKNEAHPRERRKGVHEPGKLVSEVNSLAF